ncbi:hypothetical protein [Methylocystis sp. SB2]|uniref:hypothetical protein n=1 Tax=Methylocystis sp. (strain SB2) TaxID=743836 RepID=UPI0012EE3908|nr:hypothetical protein [Methylocystis sp. SB2]
MRGEVGSQDAIAKAESDRISGLRKDIVSRIPCTLESEKARAELETMPISELILAYINYADRYVAPRRRQVFYARNFWTEKRAQNRISDIMQIEREIRSGVDLEPRLSERIHKEGYATGGARSHRWADKDFALNCYGVHHLHFLKGRKRTRELLFVEFFRHRAIMIMVGDHNSFNDGTLEMVVARSRADSGFALNGVLPSRTPPTPVENHRLARHGISTTVDVGDRVIPAAMMMTSGHGLRSRFLADEISTTLMQMDQQLGDPAYIKMVFGEHSRLLRATPQFAWFFDYLDLVLVDVASRVGARIITPNR